MCVMFFILVVVRLVTVMQRAVLPMSAMKEENVYVRTMWKVLSVISVRTALLICNRTTNMAAVEVRMKLEVGEVSYSITFDSY